MHASCMEWLRNVKAKYFLFEEQRVLECGSYDINGSPRKLFLDCAYTGVDWREGPGVDVVSLVHEFWDDKGFTVVISTEMLEHDPHWQMSLARMIDLLKSGGSLILTCAHPKRAPHELATAPSPRYYRGLFPGQITEELIPGHFGAVKFSVDTQHWDTRILALGKDELL